MRKISIYVTISILIMAIPVISLLYVKMELEDTSYSSLLDKNGEEVIPTKFHEFSKNELPTVLSTYYLRHIDAHLDEQFFYGHYFKRTLYHLFLKNHYTEEEKLLMVINHLYFDNGVSGVENAANYYFNKNINNLSTLEQIFLVYKTKNTNTKDMEKDLLAFMDQLVEEKVIQVQDKKEAIKQLPILLSSIKNSNTVAQSYTQLVIDELVKELNMTEEEIFRQGYVIETNLDPGVQLTLNQVFTNDGLFPVHEKAKIEAGMVVMEYQTAKITGVIGGRDYHRTTYNRAIDTTRQPASTFKPLMVYGPAIDLGWKETDKLKDTPRNYEMFTPRNYDYKYRGDVTLQESLSMSYNVSTAWLLSEIGLEQGLDYINQFDLFTVDKEEGYKLALGYTKVGTSPLALTKAYSVFPNNGDLIQASSLESIKGKNGRVIFERSLDEKNIFSPKTAKTVSTMLKDVVQNGTGKEAAIPGQTIAGKTGTTSYDGWFVGFNDKYVGTIWLGPDEVIPENRMQIDGGGYPATIFREVFQELKE